MKRAILIVLVLFLVVSGAFAAPVTVGGKLEVKAQIGIGGENMLQTNPGIETDLKLAVDDYNSAVVKLRTQSLSGLGATVPRTKVTTKTVGDPTREGAEIGSTEPAKVSFSGGTAVNGSLVKFDEVSFESNIGGAFGLTEATGGLGLKLKAGFFNPGPTERGEIKTIVESIKTIDGDSAPDGAATLLTVGWLDLVNVYGGIEIPSVTAPVRSAQIGFVTGAFGDVQLGPGTLGYAAHFRDLDTTVDGTEVGAGVQYAGIDIGGGLLNLGLGGQFAYKLGLASDAKDVILFGSSLGIGLVDNAIELDVDHSGSIDTPLSKIGAALKLTMPELGPIPAGIFSATVKYEGEDKSGTLSHAIDASLGLKAGATSFTVGLDANDFDNFDTSNVYLTASLGY